MSSSSRLTLIVVISLVLFFGAFIFLVAVLRDRFGRPLTDADFGDDGDEDEDEDTLNSGEGADEEGGNPEEDLKEEDLPDTDKTEEPARSPFAPEEKSDAPEEENNASEEETLRDAELETLFTELFEGREEQEGGKDEAAYFLEDILDSKNLLGLTAEECGVPASCISEERGEILTEGHLFGKNAYGGIKLYDDGTEAPPYAVSFYVICHELEFEDCKVELSKLYGKTIASGEQTFSDEDRTVYCAWRTDFGVVWLSVDEGKGCININVV